MFIAPLNSKGAISDHAHARAGGKQLAKDGPKVSSFVRDFGRLFFYICLNFSHRLIVRAVCIDNRSMVITEDIFALFLKLFAPGICSRRFTASSYQRPLESFLIVHRTLAFC